MQLESNPESHSRTSISLRRRLYPQCECFISPLLRFEQPVPTTTAAHMSCPSSPCEQERKIVDRSTETTDLIPT